MTTLAEVYLGLGLFREAHRHIQSSMGLAQSDPAAKARRYLVMAASHTAQGEYKPAIKAYSEALSATTAADAPNSELLSRALVGRGEAYAAIEEFGAAERDIRRALSMDLRRVGPKHPDIARDLEALGLTKFYAGKMQAARAPFERALELRKSLQGLSHPKVAENLSTLGSLAYMQGDLISAERFYRETIKQDEAVLGPNHPDLAGTLNNLARVQIERRRFREALPHLNRAITINMAQRNVTHDDLAFVLDNLGLAKQGVGDFKGAEEAFRMALRPARAHKHRNLAPVLTNLANLYCNIGRPNEALPLLVEARPLMGAEYRSDPWRVAWVDNVKGRCLLKAGAVEQGRKLQAASMSTLRERWKRGTYYAVAAEE
jgi:tetratricopeptide (TPR) repeat protein